jgi:putative NADH-flavin reductase
MKLFVLGATGGTGTEVVEAALRLLNGQPSGRVRVEDDRLPGRQITRAELAQFLLDEVEHPAHLRRVVGVAEAGAARAAA